MKKRQVVVKRSESCRSASSTSMVSNVRYGACQKNHAANIGAYAVDGCRKFMVGGEEATTGAFTCVACGCHRNFHIREMATEVACEYSPPKSNDISRPSHITVLR